MADASMVLTDSWWTEGLDFLAPFLVAALCGAVLGLERELQRKPTGLRTNMLIAVGSALFTFASIHLTNGTGDPTRIAAQVVTGVGFLGAGAIIHDRYTVHGLTSAATVWIVASIGMLAGARFYLFALSGALLALAILRILVTLETIIVTRYLMHHMTLLAEGRKGVANQVRGVFQRLRVDIAAFEILPEPDGRVRIEIDYESTRGQGEVLHERIKQLEHVMAVETWMK